MADLVVLTVLALAGMAGISWLAERRRRGRDARATSAMVALVCAELADDLRLGLAPLDAVTAAADRWAALRPVAVAAQLHDDLVPAWLEVARQPGADGLRDVAAAWQLSARVGSGLAETLDQVARLLASRERRARLVDAELAAARATAVVVSGLPVLVLAMGSGLGTNPWAFFLTGFGAIALAVAMALLFAGWAWLDRIGARAVAA